MKTRRILIGLLLVFANACLVWSQGLQTAIIGTVHDESGAVVPEVAVTVANVATNVSRTVQTDSAGNYAVPSLVIGDYIVKAEKAGFKTLVTKGVVVQADKTVRVDFALSVGTVSESVEVRADATAILLRTEDATTGLVVSQLQVDYLPLKGRDFVSLAQMAPGANFASSGNQNDLNRTQALNLSVNGQRQFDNNYRLDGVSIITGFVNGSTFIPSLEVLKEISVQTGQYSAASGMYSGAQVDMVVKSGGNRLHGSVYESLRNNEFNARQFFDSTAPPAFRFNQFGVTVGGPITIPKLYHGKDRTFFFFGYEGSRTRRLATGQGSAATAKMRDGDFSELLPKTIVNPFTKQAFLGNIIPSNLIAPQAQKLMKYIPLPNRPGTGINFINTGSQVRDENQYFGRVDHKLSDKDTIFFRTAFRAANFREVTINPNFQSLGVPANQNHVLTETHIFSPRIYNEAKVSYLRESIPTRTGREGADIDPVRDFGINGLNFSDPLVRGIPNANITGYLGTGENFANPRLLQSAPAFQDTLMMQASKHTLHFGVETSRRRQDNFSTNSTNQGAFDFTGQLTGNAFADFVLGLPADTRFRPVQTQSSIHQRLWSAFVQDDWKIAPRFTLNFGLRFERAGPYSDVFGHIREFDWTRLALFPTPGTVAPLNAGSNNYGPRIGFAYRLGNRTVVRGGYGIYFTQPTTANVSQGASNPPAGLDTTYFTNLAAPNLTLANGFQNESQGSTATIFDLQTIPWDYGPGYMQMWSLNVQRELPGNWVAEVGYVGSHTLHLDNAHTENTPPPGPGAVQARRPIQSWGQIRVFGTDGVAYYEGLQTRLQSSNWHGLNLLNTYSWSHCIDTKSSAATSQTGQENQEPQNQFDRFKGERGNCYIDYRHQFKIATVYALPFGANTRGVAAVILKGWQISGNLLLQSGPHATITVSGNPANTGRGAIRPNRISDGNLPSSERTPNLWFDRAAFVQAPAFTFGNAGRGIIEGPATKLVDLSLLKSLKPFESQSLELRGDFFNAFNTPQFNVPGLIVGTSNFGIVTGTGPAREIQLGLRYIF